MKNTFHKNFVFDSFFYCIKNTEAFLEFFGKPLKFFYLKASKD